MTGRPPGSDAVRNARGIAAALLLAVFFAAVAGVLSPVLADSTDASPEATLGMRMYREGILPSGVKMRGETSGSVSLSGAMGACANCHRRSGMGSAEGGTGVRPVTGAALYRPEEVWGVGPGRKGPRGSKNWPVYTDETLARAIRDGVDPSGRHFDAAMPRYKLKDADLALLVAYLKSLSATSAPGVTAKVLRFATVVDTRVASDRRNAVLDVLRAYLQGKNAGRRREEERARTAPWTDARRFAASRAWELDLWELSGPEETWEAQLEEYYRRRPVFAMIGGISGGGWGPVQRVCERHGIPDLFPIVDAPAVSDPGYYTVYFSRGVALEADVLALHLSGEPDGIRRGPVVQVYRDDETGRAAAAAFREALSRSGASGLRDVRLPADGDPPDRILDEAAGGDPPTAVVLWLRKPDLRRFADRTGGASWPGRIYLSSTLAGTAAPAALGAPTGTVYLVHPFALPKGKGERDRARLWMSARKVPPGDPLLQANAYFAVALTVDAMDQILDFFSRDYLLEKVEHMVENAVPPSSYPRLSLGPGQRFASKGSYILRYAPESGGFLPVGGWIVPESR